MLVKGFDMATIKCPNCGSDASDEAIFCAACGARLKNPPVVESATPSPVAQPNPQPTSTATQVAQTAQQTTPKVRNKTLLIVIAAAVVLIAGLAVGYVVNQQREQARIAAEAEAQRIAEIESFNQYIDDMTECMFLMLSGAADAEDLCNTTVNVWNSAIFEDSQDAWDEEIRQYYSDDFNDALGLLYSDQTTIDAVANIEDNQDQVNEIYRRLQNPPEGLDSAYDTFEEMYDSYLTLTRLATNPTGSLQSYTESFHEADQNCVDAFEKLQTKIPDKKEVE